jgi:hypothetical protein
MWYRRMMVIRFLLALMALLIGISSAHSAVSVSAVQTSVGAASTGVGIRADQAAEQKTSVNFGAIAQVPARWSGQEPAPFAKQQVYALRPLLVVFIGDRQRV